jgi:hypothetical protein
MIQHALIFFFEQHCFVCVFVVTLAIDSVVVSEVEGSQLLI